jgi:TctA family transporter
VAVVSDVLAGLAVAAQPASLLYCLVGVTLGMLVGVLPGIGPLAALSMLFPFTFHLDATQALIMLAGIWYGTAYGSSTAAILLNVPGEASSAVTSLDGYPMAREGRAGVALFVAALSSLVGGSIGIVVLMAFAPAIADFAIAFGPTEYFALMLLGLVAAASMSTGSMVKGLAMVAFGVLLGTVGTDLSTGAYRFVFGVPKLADGIDIAALAMGLFGVAEIIVSVRPAGAAQVTSRGITLRSMLPTRADLGQSVWPTLRGSAIGAFFGTLPGTGPAIATFFAYAAEKRVARDPSRFGRGAIEGVASPEAANNAAVQTAFIPTLMLGIPGSAAMAIMIAMLMIQGIAPGPTIITQAPTLFWGLVMSFWIGNLILFAMSAPLIGIWVRLLTIPFGLLYPAILLFICIGVYSVDNSVFPVWMVVVVGAFGWLARLADLPAAPMLLGFVLGPMMEEHFRRALMMSRGDPMTFLERPISGTVIVLILAVIALAGWRAWRGAPPLALGEED